jgi:5-formyltetrahydrofolate cyclo-ligase
VYDRLLPKLRAGILRIALAYDFQVLRDALPQEAHDLPMDYIVTEKQWIDCRLARRLRRERNG